MTCVTQAAFLMMWRYGGDPTFPILPLRYPPYLLDNYINVTKEKPSEMKTLVKKHNYFMIL